MGATSRLAFVTAGVFRASHDVGTARVPVGFFVGPIPEGVLMEWPWNGEGVGQRAPRIGAVDFHPVLCLVGGAATLVVRADQGIGTLAALLRPQVHAREVGITLSGLRRP